MWAIHPGATFAGVQRSGSRAYPVHVRIQNVDLDRSFLCGYLRIEGLTAEYPELTTFFDAEVIDGARHGFLTRKWDADETVDKQHWAKFPRWRDRYERTFNRDGADESLEALRDDGFMFMRWKEHFLVPNHHIHSIDGASFAGFYYIAYEKSTRKIVGFYYHHSSEWFQSLSLDHVEERATAWFDFR